jgi:hypothetical protein
VRVTLYGAMPVWHYFDNVESKSLCGLLGPLPSGVAMQPEPGGNFCSACRQGRIEQEQAAMRPAHPRHVDLGTIDRQLRRVLKNQRDIMSALTELQAQVASTKAVAQRAVDLITSGTATTDAALVAVTADLKTATDALDKAVTDATPPPPVV